MAERKPTAADINELSQRATNAAQSLKLPPAQQPSDLPQQILTVSSAFITVAGSKAQACDSAVKAAFAAVTNIDEQEKKSDFNIGTLTQAVTSATAMRQEHCAALPPAAQRLNPNELVEMGTTIMVRGAAEINTNPNGYELGVALCDFGGQIASEVEHHPQVGQLGQNSVRLIQMALGACTKNMQQGQPEATKPKQKIGPTF